jgi:hypothetical protein
MTENDVGDVRSTMLGVNRFLPAALHGPAQNFLTWVTGKALPGQRPLINATPYQQAGNTVICLLMGVTAGVAAVQSGFYWALPIAWLLVVSAARRAQVQIFHVAVHEAFTGKKRVDRSVGELISVVLLIQPFDAYFEDHVRKHHPAQTFATPADPDLAFLIVLGFLPGMTRAQLWRHLFVTLFSPKFHYLFLAARIKANMFTASAARRAAAWAFALMLIGSAVATGQVITLVVAWYLPIIFLYQISALLQFVCEHRWLLRRESNEPAKSHLARLTVGRFLGTAFPDDGSPAQKLVWVFKMLGHALVRVSVLVAGLPDHDWHHRHPASRDWPISIYARQRDIDLGCPGWPTPYLEVWGLASAIDGVFTLLSELPLELVPAPAGPALNHFPQTM